MPPSRPSTKGKIKKTPETNLMIWWARAPDRDVIARVKMRSGYRREKLILLGIDLGLLGLPLYSICSCLYRAAV